MPKWVVETKTSPIRVGLNVTGDILARAVSLVETQYLAMIWVTLLRSDIKVVVAVLEVFYNVCLN